MKIEKDGDEESFTLGYYAHPDRQKRQWGGGSNQKVSVRFESESFPV